MQVPSKLKPFFDLPKTHNVFSGGRGGAKTRFAGKLIVEVMNKAPIQIICGREIQKSLKESSFSVLTKEIQRSGYSNNFTIRESDGTITSRTGAKAVFTGLQHHTVDSIKSYEDFHWLWIEEAQSVSKKSFEVLIPTLRTDGWFSVTIGGRKLSFPLKMFLYTMNPYTWDDPINLILPESRSDTRWIKINYYDNPWFPQTLEDERIEAKKIMSPDEYLRIWEGVPFDNAESSVMSRADVQGAMERRASQDGGFVTGADIARFGLDRTVFIKRKGLQVVDKKILQGKDTQEVARQLKDFAEGGRIIIDDTGVGCITKGTLVLTPNGWVAVESVKAGDAIYSKDDSGKVCQQSVRENIKREPTRILKNGEFEFSFSHIMPYKTRREYVYKQTSWENILNKSFVWLDSDFNYSTDTNDITLSDHSIMMPNGGFKKIHDEKEYPATEFAAFLGWYVSEGNTNKKSGEIVITQKKENNIPDIFNLCSMFGKPQIKKDGVRVFNKSLSLWLLDNCYKGGLGFRHKCVPRWVANNSSEVINSFLDAFVLGDGYLHKGSRYYVTSSKWLPQDIIELIYKVGKKGNAKIKYKAGSKGCIFGREITRTCDNYYIYEYAQKDKSYNTCVTPKTITEYEDNVYELCITGSTKLYFTMCPGSFKPIWTHNGGVTDKLRELGGHVVPVNFGASAKDKDRYPDIISEMWFTLGEQIKDVGLPKDNELLNELSSRHFKYTQDERRKVESKEEYKKRTGRRSPDMADATILCFYVPRTISAPTTDIRARLRI